MIRIPDSIFSEYAAHLKNRNVPPARFSEYKKWLRYYLDFFCKYRLTDAKAERVRLFCEKLKEKKQTEDQRERAAHAISLFLEMGIDESAILEDEIQRGKDAALEGAAPVKAHQVHLPADEAQLYEEKLPARTIAPAPVLTGEPDNQQARAVFYCSEEPPLYSTYTSRKSQYTDAGYPGKVRFSRMGQNTGNPCRRDQDPALFAQDPQDVCLMGPPVPKISEKQAAGGTVNG